MAFRHKLVLLLVLVAVVPVALSGALSIHTNQKEMNSRIGDFQKRSAVLAGRSIDEFFLGATKALKLAVQFIPFDQFPKSDLTDALRIPYRQFDFVNIVALLDSSGDQLAEPAFETDPKRAETLAGHESVTAAEVEAFGRHIPLRAALSAGAAFGPAYFCQRTRTPRVALAVAFGVRSGKERWVLAVELSLRGILEKVSGIAPGPEGSAYLVDGEARIVCHQDPDLMKRRASADTAIVSSGLEKKRPITSQYIGLSGVEVAGAYAPVRSLGWGIAIEQPVEQAFAATRRMRTYTLFWVGLSLLVAVFGGVLFSRGVSGPVRELASVSTAIAEGDFDRKIPVRSRDEIGKLSESFNHMATALKRSFVAIQKQYREIQEKNLEIRRWNEELKHRVEDRTSKLKEAHQQITHSQKLAAVAELGAGVAHEINNPLTGIQGFAELMLNQTKPGERFHDSLGTILSESKRIHEIIGDLKRFSQTPDSTAQEAVDINGMILHSLRMVKSQIEDRKIVVRKVLASELPAVPGDPSALQQVFVHIITNAKNAMPDGGEITLLTSQIEGGAVKVTISDTGRGISEENISKIFDPFFTTKDEWSGKGLGLSVAHRIVEEHNGKISVDSEIGRGTTFTMIFPTVSRELHLR